MGFNHLFQAPRFSQDQVVGQQDGKRFVLDEFAGAPDGMAEAQRLMLTG